MSATSASDSFTNATEAHNYSPWGFNINPGKKFNDAGSSNIASSTNGGGDYGPMVYFMQGKADGGANYLWTKEPTLDLTKPRTLSFWLWMVPNGSLADDGMAFALQGYADNAHSNPSQSITQSYSGRTLGVWGDPGNDKTPWKNALKNSLAVEFDNVTNGEDSNYYDKEFATPGHIMAGYPSQQSTYPTKTSSSWWTTTTTYDNSKATYGLNPGSYTGTGASDDQTLGQIGVSSMTGKWYHVTFKYSPDSAKDGNGTLSYTWNDRDTNGNDLSAQTRSIAVKKEYLLDDSDTNLVYYGFSSAAHEDNNLVILDTDSDLVDASANISLIDNTQNDKKITGAVDSNGKPTEKVNGQDQLTYEYDINFKSGTWTNGLANAHIKTTLPKEFEPGTDGVKFNGESLKDAKITPNSDGTHTLDATVTMAIAGKIGKVTVSGSAANVLTEATVNSTKALAVNGGIDQTLNNPAYLVEPAIRTTTKSSIRDLTEVGTPEIYKAHVFDSDLLEYTFELNYDAQKSVVDWDGVINATIKLPEQLKYTNVANTGGTYEIKTTDDAGNVLSTYKYTAAQLEAGPVAVTDDKGLSRNPIRNHIIVTITTGVNGAVTGTKEIGAATASFDNTKHSDTETTRTYTVTGMQGNQAGAPTLTGDTSDLQVDQIGDDYESKNAVNLTGTITSDPVKNDDTYAIFASVTSYDEDGNEVTESGRHIQLNAGTTGKYNLSLLKPNSMADIAQFSGSGAKTVGQALDDTSNVMLHYGRNVVHLFAVDSDGRASNYVDFTVNVGLFKFMSATDVTFKPTILTGSQRVVGAESVPDVTLNNSIGNQWHVTASATPFKAGDKKLKGSLYYVNADHENTVLSDQAVPIADSSQLATDSSNHYNVSLTTDWNASQPDASSIDDVTAQGLYVQLNAGATANTDAYQSAITWTLTDGPQ